MSIKLIVLAMHIELLYCTLLLMYYLHVSRETVVFGPSPAVVKAATEQLYCEPGAKPLTSVVSLGVTLLIVGLDADDSHIIEYPSMMPF